MLLAIPACENAIGAKSMKPGSAKDWATRSEAWRGRELVAFASWCSSCREKVLASGSDPDKYILFSVFEDVSSSEATIRKLSLKSPCVYGEDLAETLGVKSLPWVLKL